MTISGVNCEDSTNLSRYIPNENILNISSGMSHVSYMEINIDPTSRTKAVIDGYSDVAFDNVAVVVFGAGVGAAVVVAGAGPGAAVVVVVELAAHVAVALSTPLKPQVV